MNKERWSFRSWVAPSVNKASCDPAAFGQQEEGGGGLYSRGYRGKVIWDTVRRMTDETPDYMTDEVPEYTADELGDHDDLLAEGRLGHVEHLGARWRTGFVRYEPDGHSMTVRLVAEGPPQGDTAITDLVVAEAVAIVQQMASVNHVYLELTVRSDNPITRDRG